MDDNEIQIVSISSTPSKNGIYKFENCKYRHKDLVVKNSSCCTASKISGYFCTKINKFPINFSSDCEDCKLFESL